MGKMYKVTVKGTGQLNEPVIINKTVEMEEQMALKFNGANKYEVIEAFIKANYPGVKIPNIRNFGANVILIPEKKEHNEKSIKKESEIKDYSKSVGGGILGGAIIGAFASKEDEEIERPPIPMNIEDEKNKIDLEYYKKQKELDFENQKHIQKQNQKQQKIDILKKEVENGGNKFLYLIKRFWLFLDNPWKKIAFGFIVLLVFVFLSDFVSKSSDIDKLQMQDSKFKEIAIQIEEQIQNKEIEKAELLLKELISIKEGTNLSNEFVKEDLNNKKKQWNHTINEIQNEIQSVKTFQEK